MQRIAVERVRYDCPGGKRHGSIVPLTVTAALVTRLVIHESDMVFDYFGKGDRTDDQVYAGTKCHK